MTSLHVICGLPPPQSKILATLMTMSILCTVLIDIKVTSEFFVLHGSFKVQVAIFFNKQDQFWVRRSRIKTSKCAATKKRLKTTGLENYKLKQTKKIPSALKKNKKNDNKIKFLIRFLKKIPETDIDDVIGRIT